ncbi:ABC transporter permease subunit, partial [Desulfobacter hydrogenophilus]|uniref:ABC transporter permease subunit n=1 Tax=Desulfobacter hydrogenophilus TaxID=2291 RepID=UPI0013D1E5F2
PIVRAIALVIGVLAVTNEFRHGTITPTLLVVPNRTKLMLAKLVAVLALSLALGFVVGLVMILSSAAFGSFRDFDAGGDELSILLGSTLATALNAALGLGVGVLVRNQVGAIVGVLIYGFILEDLIGLIPKVSDVLPKYGLG